MLTDVVDFSSALIINPDRSSTSFYLLELSRAHLHLYLDQSEWFGCKYQNGSDCGSNWSLLDGTCNNRAYPGFTETFLLSETTERLAGGVQAQSLLWDQGLTPLTYLGAFPSSV